MTTFPFRAFRFAGGVFLLALAALSARPCLAQTPPVPQMPTTQPPTTATASFDALDTNKDGLVSKSEYEGSNLFAQLDANHDDRISADELESILGPQQDGTPSAADRIRSADSNGDGELTDEELRRSADMQFDRLDSNRDGYLDLAEMKSGFGIPVVSQY